MFTGIIEEVGVLRGITRGAKSEVLTIGARTVLEGTKIGDSICCDGVCLTVTDLSDDAFSCDVMAETIRRSGLGALKAGDKLNLERALAVGSRLGGHIVSGHIDGTGTIQKKEREDNAVWFTIAAPPNILRYIIEKGSIAIDGISLTVAYVDDKVFKISMIPHTGEVTTLLSKPEGAVVNLENDLIGKYVEKLLLNPVAQSQDLNTNASGRGRSGNSEEISMDFLSTYGFV